MKYFSNHEISKILREIAAAYSVKNEPIFKIRAYENAADSIENASVEIRDLWETDDLASIPGVGKTLEGHLNELFKTGKVKHFNEVKKSMPEGMFELLNINGLGPKSAFKLASSLGIKSIKELEEVAKTGIIKKIPTFGEKSEQEILSAIEEYKGKSNRYLLPFIFTVSQRIISYMKQIKECEEVEPLGSLRRMVATVGDIDIGVASSNPKEVISHFTKFPEISRILAAGSTAASAILNNGVQVDIKVQPKEAFGALLQHFTGSKNHNIKLRELALSQGMSLSEYGIKENSKLLKFSSETDFYKYIGLEYIEPELRENSGEIEAALRSAQGKPNGLPKLVKLEELKGDLHLHSSYPIEPSHDLGVNDFSEIIKKAKELNYEYIGFSDHSPGFSTHTKKNIIELIKKRKSVIEQIKDSDKSIRILNLLEIDILSNGELSVPLEGLKLLDGAIAGIHSSHKQNKKEITKRLLTACNSKYVKIISHPTGRLLEKRESYEADWNVVFKECLKTGTILEINAWPTRLDLPDTLVRKAVDLGIKLIINSDAHEISQMDHMKFGVAVARRGWATRKDIVNTMPWLEFSRYIGVS